MKVIKRTETKRAIHEEVMPETEDEIIDVEKLEREAKEELKDANFSKWKVVDNRKNRKKAVSKK